MSGTDNLGGDEDTVNTVMLVGGTSGNCRALLVMLVVVKHWWCGGGRGHLER